jgi:hypothetical protein
MNEERFAAGYDVGGAAGAALDEGLSERREPVEADTERDAFHGRGTQSSGPLPLTQTQTVPDGDPAAGGTDDESSTWHPSPIHRLRHLPVALGLEGQESRILELVEALGRQIRRRPLASLAVGLGAGFVIGGALTSRAGRILLAAGARHVARELLKQLL